MSSCVVVFRDHSYLFGCWWFLCKTWRFTPCPKNIFSKFLPNILRGYIQVSQEERAKLREGVPYVKLYRYNPKHLYPKLNGYGDNGKRCLKLWQLLHTYWLPNSYWNWQEYVVFVVQFNGFMSLTSYFDVKYRY